mmetsp:Transcript_38364/g.41590  ORF Transcript_38364/g.41590 Transcript_38364/m.41590 type:complete len:1014 (+) Transcript_38364:119-3160(+)
MTINFFSGGDKRIKQASQLNTGVLSPNNNVQSNDNEILIDFLNDEKKEMTYGRLIALSLMDKSWYNPMAGEKNGDDDDNSDDRTNNNKNIDAVIIDGNVYKNCVEEINVEGSVFDEKDSDHELMEEAVSPHCKIHDFDEDNIYEKPDLRRGWACFEHDSLYRYLLIPTDKQNKSKENILTRAFHKVFMRANKKYDRAEPGENDTPTRLYHPLWIPHNQLGDFGLGIGLYFSTLRAVIVITFICGLLSLYNIIYFASDEYDPEQSIQHDNSTTDPFVRGSAVCSTTTWVPCPTCDCLDPEIRCARSNDGTKKIFALKNDCDGTHWQLAASNFGTVIFMLVAVFVLGVYMRREEVKFDEDEQTAQDYSVQITNPPGDAKDPNEWRRFFQENCDGAQVTVCTCAVQNDLLMTTLVERRERIRCIRGIQPGESLDMLVIARDAAEIERGRNFFGHLLALVAPGIPEHFYRVVALNAKIEGLSQLNYPVTNVFVTFETESDQRSVLEKLTVGSAYSSKNDVSALSDPKYLFRRKYVLNVCEPEEPNTIIWNNLNTGWWQRMKELFLTFCCTLAAIALVAYFVNIASKSKVLEDQLAESGISTVGSALIISIFNAIFPQFAKLLTNIFESHRSESSKQASLYYKIALFRWVNTAVVFFIITPFNDTLNEKNGLIPQVLTLFYSDMIITNLLALSDPLGHLNRHVLAPRAKTQDAMNIYFKGTEYDLAERYTDLTKILFLNLFYCSIFPTSFFLCAISLTLKYLVDRFNLMRTWKIAPHLGPAISKMSRQYFFSISVAVMAIICSYYWTAFPFDNICQNGSIKQEYVGAFTISPYIGSGSEVTNGNITLTFTESDVDYRYCNQDFRASTFPFVPTKGNEKIDPYDYMTAEQLISTTYFGWAALAIVIIIFLKFIVIWYSSYRKMYHGSYQAVGVSQGIAYSEVESRCAYIPQVNSPIFAYPLIACKVDEIDEELFNFTDPRRSYKYYDLSVDAKKLLSRLKIDDPPGFSIVKHWAPQAEK